MDRWTVAFYALAGIAISLFFLQAVFWSGMRMKKVPVARWRALARWWLRGGLALLIVGASLHLFAADAAARGPAMVALVGGALNAFVATFHTRVVDYLLRRQKQQREQG